MVAEDIPRVAASAAQPSPNRSACTCPRGTFSARRLRSTASVMAGGPQT